MPSKAELTILLSAAIAFSGCEPQVWGNPSTSIPPPASSPNCTYTVKGGDTLLSLSRQFGPTVDEFARENGIADPNRIYVGQTLTIPGCLVAFPPTPEAAGILLTPGVQTQQTPGIVPTWNAENLPSNGLSPIIRRGPAEKQLVAITIDDCYNRDTIQTALQVARSEGIKLTFFPVGEAISQNADLWRQAVADGHEIGNHTNSHRRLTEIGDVEVRAEIEAAQNALDTALGYHYQMRLLRPPGGHGGYTNDSDRIINIAQSLGYSVVMWTYFVDGNPDNGDIFILHTESTDIAYMELLITRIKDSGRNTTTVSGFWP